MYIIHGKIFKNLFPLVNSLLSEEKKSNYDFIINFIANQKFIKLLNNIIIDFKKSDIIYLKKSKLKPKPNCFNP